MKKLYKAILAGQQRKANLEVAKMLHQAEYRNESLSYVLDLVNSGKISKI